jgi:hypothetical protein
LFYGIEWGFSPSRLFAHSFTVPRRESLENKKSTKRGCKQNLGDVYACTQRWS